MKGHLLVQLLVAAIAFLVSAAHLDAIDKVRVPLIYDGVVHYCDFDTDKNCNKAFDPVKTNFAVVDQLNLTNQNSITDMTSISMSYNHVTTYCSTVTHLPRKSPSNSYSLEQKAATTSNGLSCKLPFEFFNEDYYFCTRERQCETGSGLAKCKNGRLLGGIMPDRIRQRELNFISIFLNLTIYNHNFL